MWSVFLSQCICKSFSCLSVLHLVCCSSNDPVTLPRRICYFLLNKSNTHDSYWRSDTCKLQIGVTESKVSSLVPVIMELSASHVNAGTSYILTRLFYCHDWSNTFTRLWLCFVLYCGHGQHFHSKVTDVATTSFRKVEWAFQNKSMH